MIQELSTSCPLKNRKDAGALTAKGNDTESPQNGLSLS